MEKKFIGKLSRYLSKFAKLFACLSVALFNFTDKAAADGPWTASTGFSTIQGTNQWYYQQRPRGSGTTTNLTWSTSPFSAWFTSDQTGWMSDTDTHPGLSSDTIRKWIAPSAGTVSITGRVFKVDTSGGAGIVATVEQNGSPIWSEPVAYNNSTGYTTDTLLGAVSINSGDSIAFIVDDNGTYAADRTGWDPTITITPTHWVTTWGSSMETVDSTVTATNFSTRYMIRVTLAGSAIRLRLSNTFGTASLTINQVFVGPHTTGANVSSNTQVYFGGSASVTIPAGQEVTSDPVNLSVTAQEDLGVSFYFSSLNGAGQTRHFWTYTTQYSTALDGTGGNHAAATTDGDTYFLNDATHPPISQAAIGWLEAVDVLSPEANSGAVVAIGDSITDGVDIVTLETFTRWVDILAQRLATFGIPLSVINEGIASNGVYVSNTGGGQPAVDRYTRDVLGQSGAKYCILFEGTNDIANGVSASTLETKLKLIIDALHANSPSIKVIGGTIMPRDGSWSSSLDTVKDAVNTWI